VPARKSAQRGMQLGIVLVAQIAHDDHQSPALLARQQLIDRCAVISWLLGGLQVVQAVQQYAQLLLALGRRNVPWLFTGKGAGADRIALA